MCGWKSAWVGEGQVLRLGGSTGLVGFKAIRGDNQDLALGSLCLRSERAVPETVQLNQETVLPHLIIKPADVS